MELQAPGYISRYKKSALKRLRKSVSQRVCTLLVSEEDAKLLQRTTNI